MLAQSFEEFCCGLEVDNVDEVGRRFRRITKKLNRTYWDSESEDDHCHVVGSWGRNTAIKGISDLDMVFLLPIEVYRRYDAYTNNGQSHLLQDVKQAIRETYPNTMVRGDGQVVVVSFENYTIEVVPAFANADGSFKYPDSNNGGIWKTTNPLPETEESERFNEATDGHYRNLCRLVRAWKNNWGFTMGGLLIDTLTYNFLRSWEGDLTYSGYMELLTRFFGFLQGLNENQSYWFALGSHQKVYSKKSSFIRKARTAYEKMDSVSEQSEDGYAVLQEIFGRKFPVPVELKKAAFSEASYRNTEQFIEDRFPLDIRYGLRIDCEVSQDGFRPGLLRQMRFLKVNKNLRFFIVENEVDDMGLPYEVYWKVRNRGVEAIRRDNIRGQILPDEGMQQKKEHTDFRGEHYVECYVVVNGVCVARDRILVPISN